MIIKADKEGQNAIEQLVDIALKQGGIQNLNAANLILHTIKLLPVPDNKKEGEKGKK